MSVMTGPDLNATADLNVTGFEKGVERAERSTESWRRKLEDLESALAQLDAQLERDAAQALRDHDQRLERHQQALEETGRGLMIFGAVTVAALGLAANEAIQWESAWAGVTKTVDGSTAEMAALEDQLRQLATTLPATHEEIAGVAEAAGQLGVARQDVAAFTKTMVDLGETTDLTADAAATSIAQLMNIMQTAPDDVGRVGAALVALGNDGASTESQIVGMAQRIAGAGAQLGMTESDVLAIANALASVGIEVEAGGAAISLVMKKIQLDVSNNAARLQDWANVAGMSADQFRTLWEQDAAAGLDAFISGLGRIQASGGDAIKVLSDMEIKGIRESDALLRMAGAGDLLTSSLDLGNQAWQENTALLEEAAKRYATTEAQVQVARNQLRDAGIDIGSVLLPAIAATVGTLADLIRAWQDLPEPLRNTLTVIALVTGALSLLGGALMTARTRVVQFQATTAALEAGALKSFRGGLGASAAFLTGPWGLAIAAGITALGYFGAKHGEAARQVDALKATLDEQTGALTANSGEWARNELLDSGVLQAAKELGIDLGLVQAAALDSGTAIDQLRDLIWEARDAGKGGLATEVIGGVENLRGVVQEGTAEWQLSAEASKAAGDAQQGTTSAWRDGADAAGDLTEEVKTLGEQLEDLSGGFLSERDASRNVRDQLREIRAAVRDYRKEHGDLKGAFAEGSASGDEFAGMLDSLTQDYQKQIAATETLTGSERKTMAVYRESRQSLIDVAQTLGMTEQEAKEYAETVLGTPKMAKTMFDAQTQGAMSDVQALKQAMEEAARNRQARIDVTTYFHRRGYQTSGGLQEEANGGIVQAYADGGISSAGELVHRVPQLRTGGGAIQWNEPETGWEAYISGKPGMESRNRAVWAEAGRRLGVAGGSRHQAFSVDIGDLRVAGVLQTPWGPAQVEGIARAAARSEVNDAFDWQEGLR